MTRAKLCPLIGLTLLLAAGCNSPYRSDRGAFAGGLGGAGVGALVGEAVGHPGVGAVVGAGVGAVSGAAVGGALDDIEARNRAEIEARIGRPVPVGATTVQDVVAMSRSGVTDDVIITHVRSHGMAAPLQANDLIFLQQQGVKERVVQTMQAPVAVPAPMMVAAPQPIVVQPYYMPGPVVAPPPYFRAFRLDPDAPPTVTAPNR